MNIKVIGCYIIFYKKKRVGTLEYKGDVRYAPQKDRFGKNRHSYSRRFRGWEFTHDATGQTHQLEYGKDIKDKILKIVKK